MDMISLFTLGFMGYRLSKEMNKRKNIEKKVDILQNNIVGDIYGNIEYDEYVENAIDVEYTE